MESTALYIFNQSKKNKIFFSELVDYLTITLSNMFNKLNF